MLRPAPLSKTFVVLAALVATACSSAKVQQIKGDATAAPLAAIQLALHRTPSAQLTGSLLEPHGAALASLTGSFQGDLTGRGRVDMKFASANSMPDVEVSWVDSFVYVRRTVGPGSTPTLAAFFRSPAELPWRQFQVVGSGAADTLGAAFDPPALIALLAKSRVPTSKLSDDELDGARAAQWVTLRPVYVGLWPSAKVNFWVGNDNRILRVRITSTDGGVQYDVHDYGIPVHVRAPDHSQIASGVVPPPHPVGAFATVRSGNDAGVAWALQRANGTSGTVCWRWSASKPLVQLTPGGVACVVAPDPADPPDQQVEFVVDGTGASAYDALVLLPPKGARSVTFGFVGGHTTTVPARTPLVWVGARSPTIGFARITMADGSTVDCGAGAIATIDDLGDPALNDEAASAPWACLPGA